MIDLPLTPFAEAELPPAVARIVGPAAPAPMRQMAARGLAPLPPMDLVVALYQLSVTGEEALARSAGETAAKLPEPVIKVALPAALDPRVLDFLARRLWKSPLALDLLLLNRALHDKTFEHLASVCEPDDLDRLAKDEQRLLRSPAIIAALYMNPRTRASTAMRAVELAARSGVVVDIPGFDDIVASLKGVTITKEDDARFEEVVAASATPPAAEPAAPVEANLTQEDIEKTQAEEEAAVVTAEGEADKKKQRFEELPVPLQIRAATVGNAFDRSLAIRSTIRVVAMAAVRSPAITLPEVIKYAANRALAEDVIRHIATRRDWTQLNSVRLALINNNKCPLGTSMSMLNFLNSRDLKSVARSKNVPGPLVKAAKELIVKRERR